jgi:hypothetical protein
VKAQADGGQAQADLEQAVRRSLAGAATGVRLPGADLAGRAAAVGRRRRRVRGAGSALAVVAATMVASGLMLHQPEPSANPYLGLAIVDPVPQPPDVDIPGPAPTARPMPALDGRAGRITTAATGAGLVLSTGHGSDIDLRHVRGVVSAHRVGDGWALVTGGDHPGLYWLTADQPPMLLLSGADTVVLDRERVAWRHGSTLSVATIAPSGRLEQRTDRDRAGAAPAPVRFVGDRVLVSAPTAGAGPGAGGWGVWQPGDDEVGATAEVVEVFGALPDGRNAVGLVPVAGQMCLATLDTAQALRVGQTACLPLLPAVGHLAALSPDGRWLVGTADAAAGSPGAARGVPDGVLVDGDTASPTGTRVTRMVTVLVDLFAAFSGSAGAVTEVDGAPAPTGRAVWPDAATVLYPADGGVVVSFTPEQWLAGSAGAVEVLAHVGDPVVLVELV